MRLRSEWVTALTLTSLAVYMMTMSRPSQPVAGHHGTIVAAGVDHMPVGTVRIDKHRLGLKP